MKAKIIMECEDNRKYEFDYDEYDDIMEACNYDVDNIISITSNNDLLSRMLEGWSNARCFETFVETVQQCFEEVNKQ